MYNVYCIPNQANVKALGDQDVKDGEILPLAVKDLGSCEIFPQTLVHNPNGRYVLSHYRRLLYITPMEGKFCLVCD